MLPTATVTYDHDDFYRASYDVEVSGSDILTTDYTFLSGAQANSTTLMVESMTNVGNGWSDTLSYTYDCKGNIETISENGTQKAKYYYDDLNQLVREDNAWTNKTVVYTYDNGGNILNVEEYTLTSASDISSLVASSTDIYTYGDSNWKDKLTSFNGNEITYDEIGNPISYYNGLTFDWQNGRQLASVSGNGLDISYTYNSDGIRTSKTVNGVTTTYTLEGSNIVKETNGTDTIWYYYDASGSLTGFELNGTPYFYVSNVQGDIIAITNASGKSVVKYVYDSWGKLLSTTGSLASTVGVKNPFRYRGYYYDTETSLYYLQSRYYDTTTKRFINADSISDSKAKLIGYNLFIYVANNPINNTDPSGYSLISLAKTFYKKVLKPIYNAGKKKIKNAVSAAKPYVLKIKETMSKIPVVTSLGQTFGVSMALGITAKYSIAKDTSGNFAIVKTKSGSVSNSVALTSTTAIDILYAPSVDALEGASHSVGGSGTFRIPYTNLYATAGMEVPIFSYKEKCYGGISLFSGLSTPDVVDGSSFSGYYSYSQSEIVYSFNYYDDFLEPIYHMIMEW